MTTTLRGRIDNVDRAVVRGWAQDARQPEQPVSLLVTLNGSLIGRSIANMFRPDLAEAGLGSGRHGFELALDNALSPIAHHRIRVTRELDGLELSHSPWLLEPVARLDQPAMVRLAGLLADGVEDDPGELDRRLAFLLRQLDRLLELRARQPGAERVPENDAAGWRTARLPASMAPPSEPSLRPQLLVIDELMPDPRRDAGSCAILSHMLSLQRIGYRVRFAAAARDAGADPEEAADALEACGIAVCRSPHYASIEEVLRRHGDGLAVVYLHRGSIAFRYARLVRHHCPAARLVHAVADLQHLRLARQADAQSRPELLPVMRRARGRDIEAASMADTVLTHSTYEAALLRSALPQAEVHVVPWSVPLRPVTTSFQARRGIAFLGDYAHAPNLDAAQRLVHEIMPLVWEHEPEMQCLLAGSRLPRAIRNLPDTRIVAVGHVPQLGDLFERVRLTAAPLTFGAGIKGKVLESLAAGVPCVCTPLAAEGLELPDSCPVVSDTHGFARAILSLHREPMLNAMTARAGLDWAGRALSMERIDTLLAKVVGRAIAR